MKVAPHTDVALEEVNMEGAKDVKIRWLISDKDNAPNFALRMFEVGKGGFTPYHSHAFEHEVYVVEGKGIFVTEEKEFPFQTGDIIYADPDMKHQFRNAGEGTLKFLCIVPLDNPKKKVEHPTKTINPFASEKVNNC